MKKIGIGQYFPYEVMNHAIIEFLATGDIDKEELFDTIKQYFNGDNRAKKAAQALYSVITRPSDLQAVIKRVYTAESFFSLGEADKKIIDLSLVCTRFPFVMDVVKSFADVLSIQELVSTKYIFTSIASIYGTNQTVDDGLAASYYFLKEGGLIKRVKPGLFKQGEKIKLLNFSKEAWIYTWWALGGKRFFKAEKLKYEPTMIFFDIDFGDVDGRTKFFGKIFG